MTSGANLHRILDYLRDCVEAEHAAGEHRILGAKNVLVLEAGAAPLDPGAGILPMTDRARRWTRAREAAGANEVLWAGWPVVCGHRKVDRQWTEVAAALLFTEVSLGRASTNEHRFTPTSRSVDLDEAALALLGIPADERAQLARDFAVAVKPGTVGPVAQALKFLRDFELVPEDLDPTQLSALDPNVPMSGAAIVWAGDAESSPFTRLLMGDLDALRGKSAEELSHGPLGALLGRIALDDTSAVHPTPAVLATTLEQERAICSALASPLTVVTGPPGTGKSQVLANTVAAALAEGQSVLLASKNNHAIDVVHERIGDMHSDAVPIRAGKASFRAEAARVMGGALARERPALSGVVEARQDWERTRSRVEQPYRQIAERVTLAAQAETARARVEDARLRLPADAAVDPLLVDADLLAASCGVARRRLHEYVAVPDRWFWQKRRKRAAEQALDEAITTVAVLTEDAMPSRGRGALAAGDADAVVEFATDVVELLSQIEVLAGLEMKLSLLPGAREADAAISGSFATRYPAATELFGAGWRDRLRPQAPGRAKARQYQSALAARAESGSGIGPLRSQVGGVLEVFPVWSVTNLAAGGWFPLTAGLFDLLIIDEASQSDIASALPLLYRAKRAMIVGDPHQLTHITSLGPGGDQQIAHKHGLSDEDHTHFSYRDSSLYGLAASRLPCEPVFLNRHFRSHPDVIGFSNDTFYGARLVVETDPARVLDGQAFQWLDVGGRYEPGPGGRSARNRAEAGAVLDVLGTVLDELRGSDRDVGIVTPFAPQRDLLVELKTQRYPSAMVTIETAHGFQGDERDVMIFSPTVTEDAPPGLTRFAANPNLLNVALTRARARTIVVGDRSFARSSGGLLCDLAAYADRVDGGAGA